MAIMKIVLCHQRMGDTTHHLHLHPHYCEIPAQSEQASPKTGSYAGHSVHIQARYIASMWRERRDVDDNSVLLT